MKLRIYSRFNDRGKEKKKCNNETDKIESRIERKRKVQINKQI